MAYRFRSIETVEDGLRRIATQQIDGACAAATGSELQANAPHAVRKRCKKLRALLRLVRGSFDEAAREQRVARDAARELASVREVSAHLEALDRLRQRDAERFGQGPFADGAAWLAELQASPRASGGTSDALQRAMQLLEKQRTRIPDWRLTQDGFAAVSEGLAKTYRRGRIALVHACKEPSAHNLHELRKYVKHHRFHLELLQRLWPGPILATVREAERLGELLGEHHDLDLLIAALSDPSRGASAARYESLFEATRGERERLERQSFRIAQRLFAEKPTRLCHRFNHYWVAGTNGARK